ncbi:hypothetical protein NDU88_001579 [Pleurodeles waltl]|uniref:Uncharacterized protein n=1 Tax=Pleurodeles waltl TaxID=8319 RepID=A0AAV7T0Y0_PLEWA|nr:hypothetical protein NDU88_001579 [Pleurodeles waltl]
MTRARAAPYMKQIFARMPLMDARSPGSKCREARNAPCAPRPESIWSLLPSCGARARRPPRDLQSGVRGYLLAGQPRGPLSKDSLTFSRSYALSSPPPRRGGTRRQLKEFIDSKI